MKSFRNILALLIAAALIGHIDKSAAQFGGPMGSMRGRPPGDGPPGPVMASGSHLIASMEQQLDYLRFQLKLRPSWKPPGWTIRRRSVRWSRTSCDRPRQ